jgi:Lar family restriction alleviation protein
MRLHAGVTIWILVTTMIPKPCPFCGGEALVVSYGEPNYGEFFYRVRCQNGDCGAAGGSAPTEEGAQELWDKRKFIKDTSAETCPVCNGRRSYDLCCGRVDDLGERHRSEEEVIEYVKAIAGHTCTSWIAYECGNSSRLRPCQCHCHWHKGQGVW